MELLVVYEILVVRVRSQFSVVLFAGSIHYLFYLFRLLLKYISTLLSSSYKRFKSILKYFKVRIKIAKFILNLKNKLNL